MVRRGGGGVVHKPLSYSLTGITNFYFTLELLVSLFWASALHGFGWLSAITKLPTLVQSCLSTFWLNLSIKAHNGVRIVQLYFFIFIIACVFILIITISIPLCHLGFGLWVKTKGNNKLLTAVNPSLVPLVLAHDSPGKHGRKMVSIWWCTLSGRE